MNLQRLPWLALAVLGLALGAAVAAWLTMPVGEPRWDLTTDQLRGPISAAHWLGTNAIGQDIFWRAVAGAATAFEVGLPVALIATVAGGVLGAIAGYWPDSWTDRAIVWMMAIVDAVPFYLLVAAVAYAARQQPWALHVALIVAFWTATARLVRAETLKLRKLNFVAAAVTLGVPARLIIGRHILPNTVHLLLIQSIIAFVAAIKAEVVLSFLGLGVRHGVSWGAMIAESTRDLLSGHWHNFVVASACLLALITALNIIADRVARWADPRMGK